MRALALTSDAYGSRGGIAKVSRDVYEALLAHPGVDGVRVLPRAGGASGADPVPDGVEVVDGAGEGRGGYLRALLREAAQGGYGLVVCGHAHLAPLAALAAARGGVPWVLVAHGIEVWGPPHWPPTQGRLGTAATAWAARRADRVVAVSALTAARVSRRFGVRSERVTVVPNSVELGAYGPGPKRPELLRRYGLEGRTVLMTLARLSPSERYKGVDETIEALPALAASVPNASYLVCGGGGDRRRLEAKAEALGLTDRVVFAGYVPEDEKADHYRLADAFVMPGRGEGFGIVYLEALACGVPVVASSADASREAVLDGELGVVVDPDDPAAVVEGIRTALRRPKAVPEGLAHFSQGQFVQRWQRVLDEVLATD